jgi:hypothetical protein
VLGLSGALIVAYRGITGHWIPMPPIAAPERIVAFAVVLGLLATVASWRKVHWTVRVVLAIAAPVAIIWYLFKPLPAASMPVAKIWEWAAIAGLISVVIYSSTEGLANRRPGVTVPLILGPVAAGVGAVILMVGATFSLGWMGAAMGLIILNWFFTSLVGKKISFSRGPVFVVIALLVGILTYDFFESDDITITEIALIAIAPLLAWIAEWRPMRNWKPWQRELLRMALVFIPVAIAVGMAAIQYKKAVAEGE